MHTRFRVLGFTVYNICSIPRLYKNVSFLMFPINEMNECLTTPQHENQIGYWVSEQGECMTWLSNKDIILCRVRSHVGIRGNETAPKSALVCRVSWLAYLTLILNIVSNNVFFPLGKMTGMMLLRASFILSSRSWEIGRPPKALQKG